MGRPTKMTKKMIDTLKEVVDNYVYCTDAEVLFMLNDKLPEKEKLSERIFQDYKDKKRQADNPLMVKFAYLLKKALIKEKMELLKKVKEGESGWQSKAWILERKFKEWSLKIRQETDNKNINYNNNRKIELTDKEIKRINDKIENEY